MSKRTDLGETGRFRRFSRNEIEARGYKLDVTWLKDESLEDSDELPEPQDLAAEAITELEAVVDDLREIVALVEKEEAVEHERRAAGGVGERPRRGNTLHRRGAGRQPWNFGILERRNPLVLVRRHQG